MLGLPSLYLIGFGPGGWGAQLLAAAAMTVLVSVTAFLLGIVIGSVGAAAKLSGNRVARSIATAYTTILRGVPDLLVIYLFYFGGSQVLTRVGQWMGHDGFVGLNGFTAGALSVAVVSGAYQTEVIRGAVGIVSRGQSEAGRSLGLNRWLVMRLVLAPQVLRAALPGMGNVWQVVVKESALISVTGLVELLRQVNVAAGSTRQPFLFYMAGAALYLVITSISGLLFQAAERRSLRGWASAA